MSDSTPYGCTACSPPQTSMLVNALSETSVYKSSHYSRAARGRHVVITGHLTAASCSLVVDELFHQDSGFSDFNAVFLSASPPSDAMRRLLKTSRHSHRLLYLQGNSTVQEVRAAGGALFQGCMWQQQFVVWIVSAHLPWRVMRQAKIASTHDAA